MLNITNVYIQYGDRILLNRINLTIGEKDKVGLVGRNGAGKSTLLKIIAGEMSPHDGKISRPSGASLGFLHQEMDIPKGRSVLDEVMTAFAEAKDLEIRIAEIHEEMETRTDYESQEYMDLLEEFAHVNDRFHYLGGESAQGEAERVLKGLGFKQTDLSRLTDEFSGGWQMRVELAKMLLRRPDFLLLDEPTNHLDIESIIWLETFLKDYTGAVILISHDKEFLDNVTLRTIEVELGNVFDYKAPYTKFVEMRRERREKQRASYENQQKVIAEKERTISRFMAKATKTKMAQSMQKQLDKIERIEIDDEDIAAMNIRFPTAPRAGQIVVEAHHLEKRYGDLLILDKVEFKMDRGDRVAFVGQNGQGKTTLAKIVVNEIPLSGGKLTLGHNVKIGYYAQNQSETLKSSETLLETMENAAPPEMRSRVRHILGAFMFSGEDADKKVSVLSGGERARLALACLLLNPFNLLVLDEPTNHLDIISKDVLKAALMEYDGSLIVVSHDRDFLSGLTNRTVEFRDRHLYNHIGDVNAFLEKRQLDNMRQVELSTKTTTPAVVASSNGTSNGTPARELSFEERKRLQRNVSNAEKKIERLEEDLVKFQKLMSDPEFYSKPDSTKTMQAYEAKKKELEGAMEEWEMATMELEG
ncbi:ribosomal protection-like ABC-F family protein [Haliscomenobacter hydrossis]|uniref:ABC transporter related protein n=1 Tax=Haliscomenobacter hydrossis (strain ATCC 27775 / DSM 1100 / LMG 10767 / O) TaxID=760192 RepID=F4KSP6_HALH1|nr:ABC-F family ATP-binding cassette domain-containing protein [Haliscomenobacter hydrossis]AEE48010.1 ABC transporter related protein [Haliscomenobacter hydrossis DSM 1100]